ELLRVKPLKSWKPIPSGFVRISTSKMERKSFGCSLIGSLGFTHFQQFNVQTMNTSNGDKNGSFLLKNNFIGFNLSYFL
ncbi:MAG: hypothetical protein ACI9YL_000641, partial [Luteibaculaceae bacterium]